MYDIFCDLVFCDLSILYFEDGEFMHTNAVYHFHHGQQLYIVRFCHPLYLNKCLNSHLFMSREEALNKLWFYACLNVVKQFFCLCGSSAASRSSKAVDGFSRPQFGSVSCPWLCLCFSSRASFCCWLYPLSAFGFRIAVVMRWPSTNSTVTTLEKSRVTLVCFHKLWAKHPHTVKHNWIKTQ